MDGLETFARWDSGRFLDDLTADLYDVAEKVIKKSAKTGRAEKGRVTVTIEVIKAAGGDPTVMFVPDVAQKYPKREPNGTILFAHGGEFHNRDPRQAAMDVRVVEMSTGEIRETTQAEPAPAREAISSD